MKHVFLLIDALRSSYLTEENMPFLYSLTTKGLYIKSINPSSGFCERSEIFSGLNCFETGNFTAIGYYPSKSVYRDWKCTLALVDFCSYFAPDIVRKLFKRYRKKRGVRMNPYLIPYKSLPNYVLTEDNTEFSFVNHRTIEDVLKEEGKKYTMDFFTALSDLKPRTNLSIYDFLKHSIVKDYYFIPLYVGVIDSVGHLHADDIITMKPYLRKVDDIIKTLYMESSNNGYSFSVLGDHGMVPVLKKIDIRKEINKLGLRLGSDYEMFLDSTIARFWFLKESASKLIKDAIQESLMSDGVIVDKSNMKQYGIPLDIIFKNGKPVYGDLVWCANPGVLICPDYFNPQLKDIRGMHGYLMTDDLEGCGLYVSVGGLDKTKTIEKAPLKSVCSELCRVLEIPLPNSNWTRKVYGEFC